MQLLLTILAGIPFVLGGLFVFWVVATLITTGTSEEEINNLEAEYNTRQIARRDAMSAILYQIGGPKNPDGRFTEEQDRLWQKYMQLETEDRKQTKLERDHLIRLQGYITDAEQAELDAGR